MKIDKNGFVLCPKCKCPTEYLDFFEKEHQGKTYTVRCHIKCPKCNKYNIVKETYTLTDVEKEW